MIIVPSNTGTTQVPVEVVSFQENGLAGYYGNRIWPLPTYSPGDLVVAFIGHFFEPVPPAASSTVPSFVRAGYSGPTVSDGLSVYYGYLPNSGMDMGFWNSTAMWCFNYVVLRKVKTATPIGGIQLSYAVQGGPLITSATAPGVTMEKTNGSSALVSFFHTYRGAAGLTMSAITPGGFTNHYCAVQTAQNATSHGLGIFSKTQATSSENTTFATYPAGAEGNYHKSTTIEVLAV
jgi:hypothetical protein